MFTPALLAPGQLLGEGHHEPVVAARAAPGRVVVGAEEAELAGALEDLAREDAGAVPLQRVRRELLLHPCPDAPPERLVLLGERTLAGRHRDLHGRLILESMLPGEPAQGVRTRARRSPARTVRPPPALPGCAPRAPGPEAPPEDRGAAAWPARLDGETGRGRAGGHRGTPRPEGAPAPRRRRRPASRSRQCASGAAAKVRASVARTRSAASPPPYASAVRSPSPSRPQSAAKNFGSSAATASHRSSAVRYRPYEGSPPSSAPCPAGGTGTPSSAGPRCSAAKEVAASTSETSTSRPRPVVARASSAARMPLTRHPGAADVRHLGPGDRRHAVATSHRQKARARRRSRGRALPARGPVRSVRSRRARRRRAGETRARSAA